MTDHFTLWEREMPHVCVPIYGLGAYGPCEMCGLHPAGGAS